MKKTIYWLLCLPMLVLMSCNTGNNPEWTEKYEEASFYVIRFRTQAAEYRPNVMLVPNYKGEYRMRRLQNGGTCKEFFIGKDPFARVDTLHSWYIADWKWGLILSKAHVVLPMRWVDVHQPDASYVRSDFDIAATGILDTIGIVKRSDIDRLLQIEPAPAATTPGPWGRTSGGISTDHLAPVYLSRYYSAQDIPEVIDSKGDWKYTKQDFLKERIRQDSLQGVYRARLAQLVYSGMEYKVVRIVE